MAPGSALRSRASLVAVQAMPIIAEDDSVPPVLPTRSAKRSSAPIKVAGASYIYNHPPYSSRSPTPTLPTTSGSDGTAPDRKPENHGSEALRHEEWITRRGGWYRIVLMALITIAIIIGLAVGLTLGLRKHNSSTSAPSAPLTALFPAGNYTLTTALSSVTTSCSSNPKTWRCYPFTLYSPASDANASSAVFFWTIAPANAWSYTISSTTNPFAPTFSNLPLTLHDANQYTERLTFNFTQPHPSVVDGPLFSGGDNATAATTTCWFNTTVTSVTLWTRIRADFPPGIAAAPAPGVNATGADGSFPAWPFRVEVTQTQAGGGGGVPDCLGPGGAPVAGGDALGAAGECGCFYRNFGLGNGTAAAAAATASGAAG